MYRNILHATDLNENHYSLCQQAHAISAALGAKFHLLHVIEVPPSYQLAQGLGFAEISEPLMDDAKIVMNLLADDFKISKEHIHVCVGSIKLKIFEFIQKEHCDLIILGSHHPTYLPAFMGSTAYAVTQHAPCDVLTLRSNSVQ